MTIMFAAALPRLVSAASTTGRTCRSRSRSSLLLRYFASKPHGAKKTVLVLGSSGALGSVVAKHLSSQAVVVGADVMEIPSAFTNEWELDGFISLPQTGDLTELTLQLVRGVHYFLHGRSSEDDGDEEDGSENSRESARGLDAIVVASGGWSLDPKPARVADTAAELQPHEDNAIQYCATMEDMRRKNLDPCLASGFIAQHFMNPSGLLVVLGATAALQPTPGLAAYGLAKSGAHFYVQTLGACTQQTMENKSVRKEGLKARTGRYMDSLSVVGILPTTIDTAANRRAFPNGDYKDWVRPVDIAAEIATWIHQPVMRPHSGSLVKVRPSDQQQGASFELAR